MFATVILAKGAKPQEIGIMDSCKHWPSWNSIGRTSQWTSSLGCRCGTVITLSAQLLTDLPKNGTTLLALPAMKELPLKEWSKFLCNTSLGLTDCQARSLRIEVLSLYPWFGKSFANACKLKPTYLQLSTQRPTDKLSEPINTWNDNYKRTVRTCKMTG